MSTIRINHQHDSSTTEIQSSSGEESSAKRNGSNHFKPIKINEKDNEQENLERSYVEIDQEKIKSGHPIMNESEHHNDNIINENKQENLIIEKNGIFTFMTCDNNNASQRVITLIYKF